ncbi:hypothetical protein QVD17_16081 [Tagetes erecta]|uniref:Uncharacterized protein n=1 Tax=Tagetes erecta TaxID=13708 RepID=A0AAD8P079_TARER|nr:hypothetical protein QVD17_16081 [Tagetes erecta]
MYILIIHAILFPQPVSPFYITLTLNRRFILRFVIQLRSLHNHRSYSPICNTGTSHKFVDRIYGSSISYFQLKGTLHVSFILILIITYGPWTG